MSLLNEFKKLNKVCQKPRYKEIGNWMVRNITREACVPTTYFLLKTPITANQVTLLAIVFGVGGSILFLAVGRLSFFWLGLMLHLSYYLDHVDGQIARCKNQVSLSGMMLDFISHYIIYGVIAVSIGLRAYFETNNIIYLYYGIVASLSLISFNLLSDSKYRAFFVEIIKHDRLIINKPRATAAGGSRSFLARIFSIIHKSCEIHVIINTITVIAMLQIFGFNGILHFGWAELLALYYGVASFTLALVKILFVVWTKKVDQEFKQTFSTEG